MFVLCLMFLLSQGSSVQQVIMFAVAFDWDGEGFYGGVYVRIVVYVKLC